MCPARSSASIDICLPGIASSVKRAATSATRSEPFAMTMNWTIVRIRNTTAPTTRLPATTKLPNARMTSPRVGVQQDEARRRHLQRQPEQRRQQQQRREGGDLQRVADVDRDQQQDHGDGDVDRDQQVEQRRRQRHDHHADDRDHQPRQRQVGMARQQRADVARTEERDQPALPGSSSLFAPHSEWIDRPALARQVKSGPQRSPRIR